MGRPCWFMKSLAVPLYNPLEDHQSRFISWLHAFLVLLGFNSRPSGRLYLIATRHDLVWFAFRTWFQHSVLGQPGVPFGPFMPYQHPFGFL